MKKDRKQQPESQTPSDQPRRPTVRVNQQGDRNVAIGGNADHSIIITGDSNQVTINRAAQSSTPPPVAPERIAELISLYSQRLAEKVSRVRLFGEEQTHPLDQVFVELTINEDHDRRPNQAEFLGLMDAELRRMRSVFGDADEYRDRAGADNDVQRGLSHLGAKTKRTIKPDDLLRPHTHAIVTGAPGCGKTTLLRYLAWQTLQQWQAFRVPPSGGSGGFSRPARFTNEPLPPEGGTLSACFPIFLELKQLTAAHFQQAQGQLEELLFAAGLTATLKPDEAERAALKQYFSNLLRAGRVAIFLDGLDEVSGASFFRDLHASVSAFLHSVYGGNTVIISTRPFALRQLGDAQAMEIQPLSPRQIEQFITHYYHDVPARGAFQRELQRRRELRELARVPALLGFILQLWRKRGSVTDDKLELYAQITRELAAQLDREKEGIAPEREWLVADPDGSLKLDLLRQLAFHQLFRGLIHPPYKIGGNTNDVARLVFTSEQLRAEAAAFAHAIKQREGITINPRHLAEDIKATALLRQVGADHYAFAHLTLQEYLAAWQLAKGNNADTCERIFCRAYFNPTLAEMELLPMTLGLVDEPGKFYEALEQLPESLDFKGLRLRARGLAFVKLGELIMQSLAEQLAEFVVGKRVEEMLYSNAIYRAFAEARGRAEELITSAVAQLLRDEQENDVRWRAASVLGSIGSERAVGLLLQVLLNDADSDIRENTAETLGSIGSDRAVEPLLQALLNDAEVSVRWHAAVALGSIGSERAVGALLNTVLKDADSYTRWRAGGALESIGSELVVKALLYDMPNDVYYGDAGMPLCHIENEHGIEAIIQALLNDTDPHVRHRAAEALGNIGSEHAVNALLQTLLNDAESIVRSGAAFALSLIRSAHALYALLQAVLNDADSDVRSYAARALGGIGGEHAMEALLKTLHNDTVAKVRRDAAEALGAIGCMHATEAMIQALLNDADPYVRLEAARALGKIGGECAVEVLSQTLANAAECSIRRNAAEALGKIGSERAVGALLRTLFKDNESEVRKSSASALGSIGSDRAVEPLLQALLNDAEFSVRWHAADALGSIGSERAVGALFQTLLSNADSGVRKSAVGALDKIGSERAVDTLLYALLNDDDSDVRWRATDALGKIGDKCAVDTLLYVLLKDDDSHVRRSAVDALGKIGRERVVDTLLHALLKDNDSDVRGRAAKALNHIGSERAVKPLLQALITDDEFYVRVCAAESLERFTNEALALALLGALRHKESSVRRKAAEVIGYYAGEKALDELLRLKTTNLATEVRQSAALAQQQLYRKLQYFNIPIPATTNNLPTPQYP